MAAPSAVSRPGIGRPWPLVGRADELERIRAAVTDHGRSVVLAGRTGVGKSRLGEEALGQLRGDGYTVEQVTATRSAQGIPLGAFAPLLPLSGGEPDEPATLLRRCAAELVARSDGTPIVLGVDDAQLLDDMSATLVHQLVATDAVVVVATLRSGEPSPDPVAALWKDGRADRIELHGLGAASVAEVLTTVLEGRVDDAAVTELMARSRGNMLFLRELVTGALDEGVLRDDGGIWRLVGDLHPTDRLVELVEDRLAGLSHAERGLLEIVAVGEPLGLDELARLADEDVAEALERKALVRTSVEDARPVIRTVHPVYGEVLRDRMPGLRARSVARALAESVGRGARRRRRTSCASPPGGSAAVAASRR